MRVLLLTVVLLSAPAVQSVTVVGDDSADRYVGSGGLLLPGHFGHSTRDQVARCVGCRWRLRDPCGAASGCLISPMPCPPDHQLLETLWSTDAGGTWQSLGAWCVGPGGPRTTQSVGSAAWEEAAADLDPAQPTVQPSRGIVPQLPTIWHSGQQMPGSPFQLVIAGADVQITATPRWEWDFGDGRTLRTDSPGSRYPALDVSHTYRRAGRYRVTCTTVWSAHFTVDGLGPYPVEPDIRQQASRTIRVADARARLVS